MKILRENYTGGIKLIMKRFIFSFAALILAFCLCVPCNADNNENTKKFFATEPHLKYTLYIGLNASDTGRQIYPTDEAKQRFNQIANNFIFGYTLYDADGFWKEDGKTFTEHSLVCVIVDAEPESVKSLMDAVIKDFRQSSILLEVDEVHSTFYSGK